ncbi:hypothetical protein G5714_011031 [Onychostoma macrolepis]|uniref:Uncharacterized protein n=1 Tax=Onychostoma macrolepis TaxID=369639 RepID=A0A7J6CR79_9TELE|nr:hypothetical protein G5714_011031 [Onychostoma macrolepis]
MNNLKFNVVCVCVCVSLSLSLSLSLSQLFRSYFADLKEAEQVLQRFNPSQLKGKTKGRPVMGFDFGHLVCYEEDQKLQRQTLPVDFSQITPSAFHNISPSKSFHISLSRVADLLSVLYCKLPILACILVLISPVQLTLPSLL